MAIVIGLGAVGSALESQENLQSSVINAVQEAPVAQVEAQPAQVQETTTATVQSTKTTSSYSSGSSDINYYTNSAGNTVQSPTYYDSTPAGATAICKDGTYSFSQSRRGTCSHHGGVSSWL